MPAPSGTWSASASSVAHTSVLTAPVSQSGGILPPFFACHSGGPDDPKEHARGVAVERRNALGGLNVDCRPSLGGTERSRAAGGRHQAAPFVGCLLSGGEVG